MSLWAAIANLKPFLKDTKISLVFLSCILCASIATTDAVVSPAFADSCSFCNSFNTPRLFQHANKEGQILYTGYCKRRDEDHCDLITRRKTLSDKTMYPGDPTNQDTWNDQASSVEFYSDSNALLLYKDHNYQGSCIAIYRKRNTPLPDNKGWVNLGDVGFDDRVSSYKLTSVSNDGTVNTRCKLIPLVLKPGKPNQLIPAA
jgi:hypothetical protein